MPPRKVTVSNFKSQNRVSDTLAAGCGWGCGRGNRSCRSVPEHRSTVHAALSEGAEPKKEIKQKLKTLSTPGRLFWRGGGDNYCYGGRDAAVRVSCRGGKKVTFREEREHGRLPRTRPAGGGGDSRRWRPDPVTPGACGEPRRHRAQLIDTSPAGALRNTNTPFYSPFTNKLRPDCGSPITDKPS